MLEWDNRVMGLRDETRIEGVLIQTFIHNAARRTFPTKCGTTVRFGLRVLE